MGELATSAGASEEDTAAEPESEAPRTAVELVEIDGRQVARLRGEVDAAISGRVEDELIELAALQGGGLIVDLSGLRYLDSSAVRSLFVVSDRLALEGGELHVVVPLDSRLRRVLRIIQLDTLVQVHDSVAAASAAYQSGSG